LVEKHKVPRNREHTPISANSCVSRCIHSSLKFGHVGRQLVYVHAILARRVHVAVGLMDQVLTARYQQSNLVTARSKQVIGDGGQHVGFPAAHRSREDRSVMLLERRESAFDSLRLPWIDHQLPHICIEAHSRRRRPSRQSQRLDMLAPLIRIGNRRPALTVRSLEFGRLYVCEGVLFGLGDFSGASFTFCGAMFPVDFSGLFRNSVTWLFFSNPSRSIRYSSRFATFAS